MKDRTVSPFHTAPDLAQLNTQHATYRSALAGMQMLHGRPLPCRSAHNNVIVVGRNAIVVYRNFMEALSI